MKKYDLLMISMFSLLAFLLFNIYAENRNTIMGTFNVNSTTKGEITDELIIALFVEEITNAVMDFYSDYYSGQIAIYNYEVDIVDVGKEEPGYISVEFGVTPQIGAHNPLGYDELTYIVGPDGGKSLIDYEHVKSYEVPERFRGYIIKPLEQETSGNR